jgi:hypothetical protein
MCAVREVEYFYFLLPPEQEGQQPHRSPWRMTLEDARKNHPGCVLIESSREVRLVTDTAEPTQ